MVSILEFTVAYMYMLCPARQARVPGSKPEKKMAKERNDRRAGFDAIGISHRVGQIDVAVRKGAGRARPMVSEA